MTEIGRKIDLRMSYPEQCCPDGYCFEGLGIHEVGYGEARRIELAIFAAREQAWDEGATKASPHGGGYLRSLLIENPYRPTSPDKN